MISILTGACIGIAVGAIAGEGMEVTVNEQGKRSLQKINWVQGFNKAYEKELLPVLALGAAIFGTLALAETVGEYEAIKLAETEEYYNNKKDELLLRTDKIMDAIVDSELDKDKRDYFRMANVIRDYEGDLSSVIVKSKRTGKELNGFEVYGLAAMTDEEIENVLLKDIREGVEAEREYTVNLINEGYWEDLDEIEEDYNILEKELF